MSTRPLRRRGLALFAAATLLATTLPAHAAEYRLGHGDALTVSVIGQPTLTVEAQPIRPDGQISLPLVQQVPIEGKTVSEVTVELTKAYRAYLANPHVVVTVAKFRPLRVTLLGQVVKPGALQFETAPTLIDALAAAGGLTERADRTNIRVIAPGGASSTFALEDLLAGRAANPRLGDGHVIEVSEQWGPDFYRSLPLITSVITTGGILLRFWLY